MGLLDYYRQFDDIDEAKLNLERRERRRQEKAAALARAPDIDLSGTEWPDLPHSEIVNAAIARARGYVQRYPDRHATAVRRLLTLQGTMKPAQIITLMRYPGTTNTLAMGDHHDHIHVGFRPRAGAGLGRQVDAILKPGQWTDLIARLGQIRNPTVRKGPGRFVTRGPD